MIFFIEQNEPVNQGIKRILVDLADEAGNNLLRSENIHISVHDVRKACKKIRSVLKLANNSIEKKNVQKENYVIRDVQSKLSVLRDTTSCIEAIDFIRSFSLKNELNEAMVKIEEILFERRDFISEHFKDQGIMQECSDKLILASERFQQYQFCKEPYKFLPKNISKVYGDGRKKYKKARYSSKDHDLHELRKHVKYFAYQLNIIKNSWPNMFHTMILECERLADMLGKHHDLVLLEDILKNDELKFEIDNQLSDFFQSLAMIKVKLANEAIFVAKRIFAEDEKCFKNRLHEIFEIWEEKFVNF